MPKHTEAVAWDGQKPSWDILFFVFNLSVSCVYMQFWMQYHVARLSFVSAGPGPLDITGKQWTLTPAHVMENWNKTFSKSKNQIMWRHCFIQCCGVWEVPPFSLSNQGLHRGLTGHILIQHTDRFSANKVYSPYCICLTPPFFVSTNNCKINYL